MGTNNAKIWGQNSTNIMSNAESFNSDSERQNGFASNTPILSQKVNTILRQNSLMTYAISKYLSLKISDFDFDFTKDGDVLAQSIINYFNDSYFIPLEETDNQVVSFSIGGTVYSKQIKLKNQTNSNFTTGLYTFLYYTPGLQSSDRHTDMIYINTQGLESSNLYSISGHFYVDIIASEIQSVDSSQYVLLSNTLRKVLEG